MLLCVLIGLDSQDKLLLTADWSSGGKTAVLRHHESSLLIGEQRLGVGRGTADSAAEEGGGSSWRRR